MGDHLPSQSRVFPFSRLSPVTPHAALFRPFFLSLSRRRSFSKDTEAETRRSLLLGRNYISGLSLRGGQAFYERSIDREMLQRFDGKHRINAHRTPFARRIPFDQRAPAAASRYAANRNRDRKKGRVTVQRRATIISIGTGDRLYRFQTARVAC